MPDEALISMLGNWAGLNKDIAKLREDQIRTLINYEQATKRRQDIVVRLHQRFCKLRTNRERAELGQGGLL